MLSFDQIKQVVEENIKPHLTGLKSPKYKEKDARYIGCFLALQFGIRQRDLAKLLNVHHTTIIYYERLVTDIVSYDKVFQGIVEASKIDIDNIILSSNENTNN